MSLPADPLNSEERQALVDLLAARAPADDQEREDIARVLSFVERHPNPFDRTIAEGHLTGAAFLLDPAGRLLLTHHRRLDIWLQLGGHGEGERRAADVALREAQEESGLLDLGFHPSLLDAGGQPRLLHVDVHRVPARNDEPAHEHLDLRFLMRTATPGAIAADERETKALEWVSLAEAERRCDRSVVRALRVIRELG